MNEVSDHLLVNVGQVGSARGSLWTMRRAWGLLPLGVRGSSIGRIPLSGPRVRAVHAGGDGGRTDRSQSVEISCAGGFVVAATKMGSSTSTKHSIMAGADRGPNSHVSPAAQRRCQQS